MFSFLFLQPVFHFDRVAENLSVVLRNHFLYDISVMLFYQFEEEMLENGSFFHFGLLISNKEILNEIGKDCELLSFFKFQNVLLTKVNNGLVNFMFLFFEQHHYQIKHLMQEILLQTKIFFEHHLYQNMNRSHLDFSPVAGETCTNDFNKVFHQTHFVEQIEKLTKNVHGLLAGTFVRFLESDHDFRQVRFDEGKNVFDVSFVFVVALETLPELFENGDPVVFGCGKHFVVVFDNFDDFLGETLGHVVESFEDEFVGFFLEDIFFGDDLLNELDDKFFF